MPLDMVVLIEAKGLLCKRGAALSGHVHGTPCNFAIFIKKIMKA